MVNAAMKLKDAYSLERSYDKPGQCIKKQRHHFADKDSYSQCYGFPGVMYECKSWTIENAECWKTDTFKL